MRVTSSVPAVTGFSHTDVAPETGVGIEATTTASDLVYVVTAEGRVIGFDVVDCPDGDVDDVAVVGTERSYTRQHVCYATTL